MPYPGGKHAPGHYSSGAAAVRIVFVAKGAVYATDDTTTPSPSQNLVKPSDLELGDTLFVHGVAFSSPQPPVENPGPWVEVSPTGSRSKLWKRTATLNASDNFTVPEEAFGINQSTYMFAFRADNGNALDVVTQSINKANTEVIWLYNSCPAGTVDDTLIVYHGARNIPNNNGALTIIPAGVLSNYVVIQKIIANKGPIEREWLGLSTFFYESSPTIQAAGNIQVGPTAFNGDTRSASIRFKIAP